MAMRITKVLLTISLLAALLMSCIDTNNEDIETEVSEPKEVRVITSVDEVVKYFQEQSN